MTINDHGAFITDRYRDLVCGKCARQPHPSLVEGDDYYLDEDGCPCPTESDGERRFNQFHAEGRCVICGRDREETRHDEQRR
jgi:hypothetical protein